MTTTNAIPEKFSSIMIDFVNDLNRTFPEYKSKWWVYSEDTTPDVWVDLYNYCLTIYPERFFDILYQNEEFSVRQICIIRISYPMLISNYYLQQKG